MLEIPPNLKSSEIEEWYLKERTTIFNALFSRYKSCKGLGEPFSKAYNRKIAWLSEMPVCRAIFEIPLPFGFLVTPEPRKVNYRAHYFAERGDEILCIASGQFLLPEQYLPEWRIRRLQSIAPNLLIVDTENTVAVLYGNRFEIKDKLSIDYPHEKTDIT